MGRQVKVLAKLALSGFLLLSLAGSAHAGTIDFIKLTEGGPGYPAPLGESAWNPLVLTVGGATVTITGHASDDDDSTQYAYLDWGNAGLGVCKDATPGAHPGSSTNRCNPSSDDNTTFNEYLEFVFDRAVTVNQLWFNNNHDGGFGAGDEVKIEGSDYAVATGYTGGANGIGPFSVSANTVFRVAFGNEQFYVSGMEVTSVPESGSALLMLLVGLLSVVGIKQLLVN